MARNGASAASTIASPSRARWDSRPTMVASSCCRCVDTSKRIPIVAARWATAILRSGRERAAALRALLVRRRRIRPRLGAPGHCAALSARTASSIRRTMTGKNGFEWMRARLPSGTVRAPLSPRGAGPPSVNRGSARTRRRANAIERIVGGHRNREVPKREHVKRPREPERRRRHIAAARLADPCGDFRVRSPTGYRRW